MCQFPRTIITSSYSESNGMRMPLRIQVPCGKCLECKKARASAWSFRLEQESLNWSRAAFITLTYDDAHLPIYDEDLDRVRFGRKHQGLSTLYYRDVQLFLKNLRKKEYGTLFFKYFAVGEYGPNSTIRPHYHLILFHNGPPSDQLYSIVEKVWHKGRVTCSDATPGRLYYISKYCCDFSVSVKPRHVAPFMHCSNRPAIGSNFIDSALAFSCYDKGQGFIQRSFIDKSGCRIEYKMSMPRFYREKMDMVKSYDELVQINKKETYRLLNNPPAPEPSVKFCGLLCTQSYLNKCKATFEDLVNSHKYREYEQHIKFPFSFWFNKIHEFEHIYKRHGKSLLTDLSFNDFQKIYNSAPPFYFTDVGEAPF